MTRHRRRPGKRCVVALLGVSVGVTVVGTLTGDVPLFCGGLAGMAVFVVWAALIADRPRRRDKPSTPCTPHLLEQPEFWAAVEASSTQSQDEQP